MNTSPIVSISDCLDSMGSTVAKMPVHSLRDVMNNINCNIFLGKFPTTGFSRRGMNRVEDENDGRFDILLWRKDASFDDGRGRDNNMIN